MTNVISGRSSGESLGRYDPDGSLVRMYQDYLLPMEGDSSTVLLVTWPRWGTLLAGVLSGLSMWERGTGEIESSLWATPNTMDSLPPKSAEALNKEATIARPGRMQAANLRDQVNGMWPTPSSLDWKDGSAEACRNVPVNSLLGRAVHFPTPQVDDAHNVTRTSGNRPSQARSVGASKEQGSLNPDWVTWLMGFPSGWLNLTASHESQLESKTE